MKDLFPLFPHIIRKLTLNSSSRMLNVCFTLERCESLVPLRSPSSHSSISLWKFLSKIYRHRIIAVILRIGERERGCDDIQVSIQIQLLIHMKIWFNTGSRDCNWYNLYININLKIKYSTHVQSLFLGYSFNYTLTQKLLLLL